MVACGCADDVTFGLLLVVVIPGEREHPQERGGRDEMSERSDPRRGAAGLGAALPKLAHTHKPTSELQKRSSMVEWYSGLSAAPHARV